MSNKSKEVAPSSAVPKEREWRGILARWKASGRKGRPFCKRKGIEEQRRQAQAIHSSPSCCTAPSRSASARIGGLWLHELLVTGGARDRIAATIGEDRNGEEKIVCRTACQAPC
jgi:hypothetical protein